MEFTDVGSHVRRSSTPPSPSVIIQRSPKLSNQVAVCMTACSRLEASGRQGFGSPSGAGLSCTLFLYSCTLSWNLGSSKASAMNSSVLQVSVVSLQRKITWVTQGACKPLGKGWLGCSEHELLDDPGGGDGESQPCWKKCIIGAELWGFTAWPSSRSLLCFVCGWGYDP